MGAGRLLHPRATLVTREQAAILRLVLVCVAGAIGQLLATGISVMIGLSVVLHIGVSLAVIPATGVTLPFMSYGRSSLIVALAATGVLASVGRARRVS